MTEPSKEDNLYQLVGQPKKPPNLLISTNELIETQQLPPFYPAQPIIQSDVITSGRMPGLAGTAPGYVSPYNQKTGDVGKFNIFMGQQQTKQSKDNLASSVIVFNDADIRKKMETSPQLNVTASFGITPTGQSQTQQRISNIPFEQNRSQAHLNPHKLG